jgi:hypothetical protein
MEESRNPYLGDSRVGRRAHARLLSVVGADQRRSREATGHFEGCPFLRGSFGRGVSPKTVSILSGSCFAARFLSNMQFENGSALSAPPEMLMNRLFSESDSNSGSMINLLK